FNMKSIHKVFVACLLYFFSNTINAELIGNYTASRRISNSPLYHLYWWFDSTRVGFAVQAKTTGWIGFGINGRNQYEMIFSDVMVGWYNSEPILVDGWVGCI